MSGCRYLVAALNRAAPFGDGTPKDCDPRSQLIIVANNPEDAARKAISRFSVLHLEQGALVAVWTLGNFPAQFHAQYDGPAMNDDHTATDAKLVIRPLGRPSVKATA